MSLPPPNIAFPTSSGDRGFAARGPSVGASQRASLGRGLAFVLLLAASALASIYAPMVLRGPDGAEDTATVTVVTGR